MKTETLSSEKYCLAKIKGDETIFLEETSTSIRIADIVDTNSADFLYKAVNNYDSLLSALKEVNKRVLEPLMAFPQGWDKQGLQMEWENIKRSN